MERRIANHCWGRTVAPLAVVGALAMALMSAEPIAAQSSPTESETVAELRRELEALRLDYERRIADLERRLADLEPAPAASEPEDAAAALRAAARAAAAAGASREPEKSASATTTVAVGKERNLNRLNPEISFTGIVIGTGSNRAREEFSAQEFELDLQTALDPFSRTRWTIAFGDGEVEIEEGYLEYNSLPGGMNLLAGKFRQRFGPLNRQHLHALPQSSYPLVYETYFGEEGLAQTGLALSWLPANPWASSNELTLEITDGENETAFGGEAFEDLAVLVRLQNFWELSDSTYLEWGLSGVVGETAGGGDNRIWGTDLTWNWRPPGRAKYREVTWRTEVLFSERDDPFGRRQDAVGGYTYAEGLLARNLWGGVRFDHVEDPSAPNQARWAVVPYVSWWQSEYVRLRGEYGRLEDDLSGEAEDRFTLQLTWAAGPHKHESY